MMTAFVAMQELPLSRKVRAAPYESLYGESLLELSPGERVSVRDLLYGLILRSGNDAARDLALAVAGSERAFVRRMNRGAAALGLENTHFANPIGLDQKGNYSTAFDLADLGRRLMDDPAFAKIAAARTARLRSLSPPRTIETLNDLLYRVPWANGIKTGHTFGADYVLVASAQREGTELISAVLGTWTETQRDLESMRLLEYGFSLHRRRMPIRRGEVLARPSIRYTDEALPLRAPRAVAVGVRRGQRLRVRVRAPSEVEGPVRRGAALGRASVFVDGLRVANVQLRSDRRVPEATLLDRGRSVVSDNSFPIGLAGLGIIGGMALLLRQRRRKARREEAMIGPEGRYEQRRRQREERARL